MTARDDRQRRAVAEQSAVVLAEMSDQLLGRDKDAVRDTARRLDLALSGNADEAFRDDAGRTSSI